MPYNIGPRIYIDGEKEFRTAIKNINNELKTLDNNLTAASAKFDKQKNSVQSLTTQQELLREKQDKLNDALTKVRTAMDNLDESSDKYETQLAQLKKQESEYEAELEETKKALEDLGDSLEENSERFTEFSNNMRAASEKLEKIGTTLTSVGDTLTRSFTVPLVAAGTLAVKSAVEFEDAFVGVRKTVDATEEQFAQLSDAIIQMSTEMPESATEIAAVAEAAGQMGIATEKIEDFTKVMVMLGDTTDISSEEAAMSLARLVNVMNTSQDDFDNLGSTIVDLGNNFAATESEIVDTAQRIASAGKQVGASEADILGFATAMRAIGLESEAGGTAISKTMMNIRVACETGGDALEQYAEVAGMTSESFKQAFEEDAASAIISFVEGLGRINDEGGSAIVTLTNMGITEVRLRNALLSLASGSDTLKNAVETANEAWTENNALQTEAEKKYADTESQLAILKNKASALAISFGQEMLPALNDFVDDLGDAVEWLTNLDEETKVSLIRWAAFVAVLGPVLSIVGRVTTGLSKLTKGIGSLASSMPKVIAQIKSLVSALNGTTGVLGTIGTMFGGAASTIGIFGIALTAIAIPIARQVSVTKKAKAAMEEYTEAAEECAEETQDLIEATENLNESYESSLSSVYAQESVARELNDALQELVETEGNTAEGQAEIAQKVEELNDAIPGLNLTYDATTNSLSLTNAEIESNIDAMVRQAETAAQVEVYQEYYKQMLENRTEMQKVSEQAETTQDSLTSLYTKREELQKKMQENSNGTNGLDMTLFSELEEVNAQIQIQEENLESLTNNYSDLSKLQQNTYNSISLIADELGVSADTAKGFADEAVNGTIDLNDAIADCKDKAVQNLEAMEKAAEEVKEQMPTTMKSAGTSSKEGFIQGFDETALGEHAALAAEEIEAQFKKALGIQSPSKVFYEIGEYTLAGLFNSFEDAEWTQLTDYFVGAIVEGAEAGTLSVTKLADALGGIGNISKLSAYASGLGYDVTGLFGSAGGGYTGSGWSFPTDTKTITSEFGYRESPGGIGSTNHQGIDIGAAMGDPIYAAQSGTVTLAGWYGGYGNTVKIDHGNGLETLYGHMSVIATDDGDSVTQGQIIGYVGSTGNSTGAHLHFSVIEDGIMVDPRLYLGSFAKGTHYLPRDGIILAHEGEAVIPKAQNPWANGMNGNGTINNSDTSYNIVNNFTETNYSPAQIARRMKQTVKQISRR